MRDAILKPDVESNIDEYLEKSRSVTHYDLANRFGVRMSVARRILRQKEADGVLVPYIREGGLEVYTTPAELEKRESETPIMIADALEEVASSVPKAAVITEEMDAELIAASSAGSVVKPSKLARKRREAGEKKEKAKAHLPEVIVEPLVPKAEEEEEAKPEPKPKPKAKPKARKPTRKKAEEEAKPKKKVAKKKAEEEKSKTKKTPAKKAEEEAKPTKKVTKKKTEEEKSKTKKTPAKKAAAKKTTTKKAETKPKKTTKKADEKPKASKTTKKKS